MFVLDELVRLMASTSATADYFWAMDRNGVDDNTCMAGLGDGREEIGGIYRRPLAAGGV